MGDYSSVLNGLVALPSSLQIELLSKWITIKEVGLLDSALCAKTPRASLLCSWKEDRYTFSDSDIVLTASLATWVVNRGHRVDRVVVPERFVREDSCKIFFQNNHDLLRSLSYPFANQFEGLSPTSAASVQQFARLASTCHNIQELKLHSIDMEDFDLRSVLANCSKLSKLELLYCSNVDLKMITECGQQIVELNISGLKSTRKLSHPNEVVNFASNTTLRKLHLFDMSRRMDRTLVAIFICSCIGLRELCVDQLCGFEICNIVKHCPLLTTLRADLRFDEEVGIDANEFQTFASDMRNMRYLQLSERTSDTHFMTAQLLLVLLETCPDLEAFMGYDVDDAVWEDLRKQDTAKTNKNTRDVPSTAVAPDSAHRHTAGTSALRVLYMKSIRVPALSQVLEMCPQLNEVGIIRFANFDSTLEVLSRSPVTKVLLHLPFGCNYNTIHLLSNLTALTLIRCIGLRDEHLSNLLDNNPDLCVLRLTQCDAVSNVVLSSVLSKCSKLTDCSVEGNFLKPQDVDELVVEGRFSALIPLFEVGVEIM